MSFLLIPGLLILLFTAAEAPAQDKSQPKSQPKSEDLFAQYFETCVKDWDKGTHMTQKEWSRACRRMADQRAKFRLK